MFILNGFDDFISKPIDTRQLNLVLNKFIRDKQPPEVIKTARQQNAGEVNAQSNAGNIQHPLMDSFFLESLIGDISKTVVIMNDLYDKAGQNDKALLNFTIAVHGIRSSLLNIGEKELAETAHKLEKSGQGQNLDTITEFTPGFLHDLKNLLEKLKANRGKNTMDKPDEDIEGLRDKLLSINKMCAEYNKRGVMNIIADIKDCSIKTRTVLDNIMGHMLHSEFMKAADAAADYAADLNKK
jgi:HPt (histidine-containing phosphotransfer) domain-containing protein